MRVIKCPNCQAELPVDGIPAGTRIQCAGCENKFYMPDKTVAPVAPGYAQRKDSDIFIALIFVTLVIIGIFTAYGIKILAEQREEQRKQSIRQALRDSEKYLRELDDWKQNILKDFKPLPPPPNIR